VRAPPPVASATLGIVLIGLAAVSWGTTGSVMIVLQRRVATSPLFVGTARLWIAALFLGIGVSIVAARRPGRPSTGPAASQAPRLHPRERALAVAAGACMAGYQAAYFTAVAWAGIAVTALVTICSAPIFIGVLAPLVLGERLSARVGSALGLGVVGTALMVAGPGGASSSPRFGAGIALGLAAGLGYALYAVLTKAALTRAAALPLTALTFGAGAILVTPALLFVDAPLAELRGGWPWLLYLGGVATAGAYAIYSRGLAVVPASVAGIVTLLEPLTATCLGVLIFNERLGLLGALGAALLLVALVLLTARSTPSASPNSEGATRT
jgi:DME family drug/metabolite transporter